MINSKSLLNVPARRFSASSSIFKGQSVAELLKTAAIYKASQTDIVLEKGEALTNVSYRLMGKKLTNSIIENTGGKIFTSGPTIKTLIVDTDKFYIKNDVWSAANFVMEGIENDDVEKFDYAKDFLIETLGRCCKTRPYSHLAIKLTGLGHMEMFVKANKAQDLLLNGLFKTYSTKREGERPILTKDSFKQFLNDNHIEFTETEVDEFFTIAKFADSEFSKEEIGEIEFYENVHAYYVHSDTHKSGLIRKICAYAGINKSTNDALDRCCKRVLEIVEKASMQKTKLLVDAEQSYIQATLDSLTRQIQSHYHKDQEAFVLNGYQSYLVSSPEHVKLEIERCKRANISTGIKLVRGAYMGEERRLAQSLKYQSPVWDTIEQTHEAYNTNMRNILKNLDPERGKDV